MNRSIEAIPTWALCYIINGDASGLTGEEISMEDELFAAKSREPICPTITVSDSWTKNKPN